MTWDRELESYLRDRGVTQLAAVVCTRSYTADGVVHLLDGSQADLAARLLTEHPQVADVDAAQQGAELLHFRVKPDAMT